MESESCTRIYPLCSHATGLPGPTSPYFFRSPLTGPTGVKGEKGGNLKTVSQKQMLRPVSLLSSDTWEEILLMQ